MIDTRDPSLPHPTLQRLASAYSLEVLDGPEAEVIHLRAPDGQLCLQITLTPEGPRIAVQGLSVAIVSQGDLSLEGQRVTVRAREDLRLEAGGTLSSEAFDQRLRARRGDVDIVANDDVLLNGERIRLNSPRTPADLRQIVAKRNGDGTV